MKQMTKYPGKQYFVLENVSLSIAFTVIKSDC